ncbi:MAG: cyclic nucleotide-binding domain-containing protein [Verrucomicrobia bacterium]|nr:cyclic nucleotide-binding domain-containing protein [Verrucomicrobiota bacterium]
MATRVRQATGSDAGLWVDLAKLCLGNDYLDRRLYDLEWAAAQLAEGAGGETWLAEEDGACQASISFLPPLDARQNTVANLGRNLFRPESFSSGAVAALLKEITAIGLARAQAVIARVEAADLAQQNLFESEGYICTGFQPCKHLHRGRRNILFYACLGQFEPRGPFSASASLPQVDGLARLVRARLGLPLLAPVADSAAGLPLESDLEFREGTAADLQRWLVEEAAGTLCSETSSGFHLGFGLMRIASGLPLRVLFATRAQKVIAALSFFPDEQDRCVRLIDAFALDDTAIGPLLGQAAQFAKDHLRAAYVEVDMPISSPRLLKTAERLGFAPVAYLPGFATRAAGAVDVVKMVKLHGPHAPEQGELASQARTVAQIVERTFEDMKMGVAIIDLLRTLAVFQGLGDGELRRLAALFTQRLFRPGERVFNKDDSGCEAYIVLRGQVEIFLAEGAGPIAAVHQGEIFGELAFLDGAPRAAFAVASQPTILLVVQKSAFTDLAQREPHLGLVILRNIAVEMSQRLRQTNLAVAAAVE